MLRWLYTHAHTYARHQIAGRSFLPCWKNWQRQSVPARGTPPPAICKIMTAAWKECIMRDLSRRAPGPRRLSTHVSISIRACIIVRRVYALPPRNFMEILEYISLRASPSFPAQSFATLLRLQEIFMKIDLYVTANCAEIVAPNRSFSFVETTAALDFYYLIFTFRLPVIFLCFDSWQL